MIGFMLIKQFGPTPELSAAARGDILRETLGEVAANHHRFMHHHFQFEAFQRYGYKPRKGMGLSGKAFYRSYWGRKLKQKKQQLPLVWSGEQRTLAKIRDVRATKKRATLVQHARGLNRRNPASQIHMNEEIRAVAPFEAKEAVQLAGKLFGKKFRGLKASKTIRVG